MKQLLRKAGEVRRGREDRVYVAGAEGVRGRVERRVAGAEGVRRVEGWNVRRVVRGCKSRWPGGREW
jgi:hypothetical protein